MTVKPLKLQNLADLRDYVYFTLCERESLEPGCFTMTERVLLRGGRPCGIYFSLDGPRSVKFTAIWETERDTILFYNSGGERYLRTRLGQSPSLAPAAA